MVATVVIPTNVRVAEILFETLVNLRFRMVYRKDGKTKFFEVIKRLGKVGVAARMAGLKPASRYQWLDSAGIDANQRTGR